MDITVSVIVPVYNMEQYITECLDSICKQTLTNMEIICVNDGSTDGTRAILEEYAKRDSRIYIIDKSNTGYGHTVNTGIQAARGRYISIIEADDFAEPNMLQLLFRKAEKFDLDVSRCQYYRYRTKRKKNVKNKTPGIPVDSVFAPVAVPQLFFNPPAVWASIYRKTFLDSNGIRFLETPGVSYQDTSFSFKVYACAKRFMQIDNALIHYRTDNVNSSAKSREKIYTVCAEYDEIRRFIENYPGEKTILYNIMNRAKYNTYRWNLRRIPAGFRPDFTKRMSNEFREALAKGEIDWLLFGPIRRIGLWFVVHSPFFYMLKTQIIALFKRR